MVYVPRHLSPDSKMRLLDQVECELQRREERSAEHERTLRERENRIREAEMEVGRREEAIAERETIHPTRRHTVRFALPTLEDEASAVLDPSPPAQSQSPTRAGTRVAPTRLPSPAAPLDPEEEVQMREVPERVERNARGKKRTRGRSAFSFFLAEASGRYVAEARAQGMKLLRGGAPRMAAEEWSHLENKSRWEAMAEEDKQRFGQKQPPAKEEEGQDEHKSGAKRRLIFD